MRENIPKIQFEKKIYERLENMDKNLKNLVKINYMLIRKIVPEEKPTKKEIEIFKQRRMEKVIPLKEIEKRLKNV